MHVLPHGFVKLRHYGLLAPGNVNTRLAAARVLLADPQVFVTVASAIER
jgi:hypothetical protein